MCTFISFLPQECVAIHPRQGVDFFFVEAVTYGKRNNKPKKASERARPHQPGPSELSESHDETNERTTQECILKIFVSSACRKKDCLYTETEQKYKGNFFTYMFPFNFHKGFFSISAVCFARRLKKPSQFSTN